LSDYHLHLHPHQPTDEGPPPGVYPDGHVEAYVEAAAARGINEVGFTEHLYRCIEAEPIISRFWEQEPNLRLAASSRHLYEEDLNLSLNDYVEVVLAAKARGLPVLLGLEVDFFRDRFEAVIDLLAPYPWDYLIGSVHFIGGWSYDDPMVVDEYQRRGVDRAWEHYFALETELAASGAVDVLAHVDVIKKLGYRPPAPPRQLYEGVVAAAASSGTAVEVSSQGLRFPAKEIYPAPDLLAMFRRAGVGITLASDAHRPRQAGWGRRPVVEAALAAGYTHNLRFAARCSVEVPLPELAGLPETEP